MPKHHARSGSKRTGTLWSPPAQGHRIHVGGGTKLLGANTMDSTSCNADTLCCAACCVLCCALCAGDVVRAPSGVMHGKTSPVFHTNTGLLEGLDK